MEAQGAVRAGVWITTVRREVGVQEVIGVVEFAMVPV